MTYAGKIHKIIKARKIWDMIAESSWKSAEPGVVYLERYNKWFNNKYFEYINCVNPCGEEGLPNWGVCNLASINVAKVNSDKDIEEVTPIVLRILDNVIDLNFYPIKEAEVTAKKYRSI